MILILQPQTSIDLEITCTQNHDSATYVAIGSNQPHSLCLYRNLGMDPNQTTNQTSDQSTSQPTHHPSLWAPCLVCRLPWKVPWKVPSSWTNNGSWLGHVSSLKRNRFTSHLEPLSQANWLCRPLHLEQVSDVKTLNGCSSRYHSWVCLSTKQLVWSHADGLGPSKSHKVGLPISKLVSHITSYIYHDRYFP